MQCLIKYLSELPLPNHSWGSILITNLVHLYRFNSLLDFSLKHPLPYAVHHLIHSRHIVITSL